MLASGAFQRRRSEFSESSKIFEIRRVENFLSSDHFWKFSKSCQNTVIFNGRGDKKNIHDMSSKKTHSIYLLIQLYTIQIPFQYEHINGYFAEITAYM